jgi:hypothetical protein
MVKNLVLKQMYFYMKDGNAVILVYFKNQRTVAVSTSEHLPEDGEVRAKHVAV